MKKNLCKLAFVLAAGFVLTACSNNASSRSPALSLRQTKMDPFLLRKTVRSRSERAVPR